MHLDIEKLAKELIVELLVDSDKLKERAEGVKLFFNRIIQESEKLNGRQAKDTQSSAPQGAEEQANKEEVSGQ